MTSRDSQPQGARQPGRSFEHPEQALGSELLDRTGPSGTAAKEDFRAREDQADVRQNGVAERAKVIGVLRKMDELVAERNLPVGQQTVRRALELAAGRAGLTIEEYEALVRGDAELEALQQQVIQDAESKLATPLG